MAAMGVNTLRLYNANPSNFLAYQRYNGQYGITLPGKNHVPFFDACERYGLKVSSSSTISALIDICRSCGRFFRTLASF